MKYKLKKEQILSIPSLLETYSGRQIAKEYGVHPQSIYYHMKRLRSRGLYVPKQMGRRTTVTKNDIININKNNETDTRNQTGTTTS